MILPGLARRARMGALGYPYAVAGVLMAGKCFCPSRTPGRCGNYKGPGTPLPFCAEVIHLPPRHAAWRRWRFAAANRPRRRGWRRFLLG